MGPRGSVWHNILMDTQDFQELIWDYYHKFGRTLPWREITDPYAIFISEVMLQQTQVARVLMQFPLFMTQFPDFATLASAATSDVLTRWQGMGYNRRALWLKRAAEMVMADYGGELPSNAVELIKLPGIGPNTAGSIAGFAFNQPAIFIETNIRRTFIHHFFEDKEGIGDAEILPLIEKTLDWENPREWYWALMDYGANLAKTTPNPNRRSKHYARQSKFEGSRRQLRAELLRQLIGGSSTIASLSNSLNREQNELQSVVDELAKEGFIKAGTKGYELVQ